MTTNADIKKDIQELNQGSPIVELYSLDATIYGDTVYYFTAGILGDKYVKFNGIQYSPIPMEAEGFEIDGEGKMPRPRIRVANINMTFVALINSFKDLVNCKITRYRTYEKYLDDQAEADPSAQFPKDVFYIERKTRKNKFLIEWELKATIDMDQTVIPKGQALEICSHRYRIYDSLEGKFKNNATCPYTGTNYFDSEGAPTTIDCDKCGKKLFDCKLRYPNSDDELPTYAFPGIGKIGYPYRR